MSEDIYMAFTLKPIEAWYALSQAEQQKGLQGVGQAMVEAGGEGLLYCRSDWSSEEYEVFGVERYPDMASLMKAKDYQLASGWHRYFKSRVVLGTAPERPAPVAADPGGIYKLYLMRLTPAAYRLSLAEREAALTNLHQDEQRLGVTSYVQGSVFSSERFLYFGVQHYPDIAAVREHHRCMEDADWFQYTDAEVLLGTFWRP